MVFSMYVFTGITWLFGMAWVLLGLILFYGHVGFSPYPFNNPDVMHPWSSGWIRSHNNNCPSPISCRIPGTGSSCLATLPLSYVWCLQKQGRIHVDLTAEDGQRQH